MNIFYTNECPVQSANEHNYVHARKMIVEYSQILSSAHHELDGDNAIDGIYKNAYPNHPSTVWARKSYDHYVWVWECAMQLCKLYSERTGKAHKTEDILFLLSRAPKNIPEHGFVNPPVAAPEEFKALAVFGDTCKAYQKYLCSKFDEWQSRAKPIKVEFDIVPDWYCVN